MKTKIFILISLVSSISFGRCLNPENSTGSLIVGKTIELPRWEKSYKTSDTEFRCSLYAPGVVNHSVDESSNIKIKPGSQLDIIGGDQMFWHLKHEKTRIVFWLQCSGIKKWTGERLNACQNNIELLGEYFLIKLKSKKAIELD